MANKAQIEKQKRRVSSAKEAAERTKSTFTPTSFKVPKGMEIYKFRDDGKHLIDVIPFEATDKNPACDPGLLHYEITFYVHEFGPNRDHHCCPIQTFKRKKCPVCEHRDKIRQNKKTDEKLIRSLWPKKRHLMGFLDRAQLEKGIQLYYCGHKMTFGETLQDAIDTAEEDSGADTFHDPEHGKRLKVTTKEAVFEGNKFQDAVRIDFLDRKSLDEKWLKKMVVLDNLPIEKTYEELSELFFEGTSAKKNGKPKDDEDEDEDDEDEDDEDEEEESEAKFKIGDKVKHAEHGVCDVAKVSGDGSSINITDEDGEIYKGIDPDDLTLVKDKPKKDDKKKPKKKDEDDEDAEDEDDEDEPDDDDSEEDDEEDDEDEEDETGDDEEDDEDEKEEEDEDSEESDDEEGEEDDEDEEEDDEPVDDDEEEEEEEKKPAPKKPAAKKPAPKKGKK